MILLNNKSSLLLLLLYVYCIYTINYVNCWKINTVNIISKISMIRNNFINNDMNINKVDMNNFESIISRHKKTIIPVILSSCFIACQLSFPIDTIAQSSNNINKVNDNNQKVYFGVGCFWVSVCLNIIQTL